MHEEGVTILAGTDVAVIGVYPGASLHDELGLLVRDAGMTPLEALRAATSAAARLMGMSDRIGTVAPGMRADLVLLSDDPTRDIANTRHIEAVMARGRMFRRAALDSLRASVLDAPDLSRNDWRPGS
jgi:imidazolonepropionase-like amidohydrolase